MARIFVVVSVVFLIISCHPMSKHRLGSSAEIASHELTERKNILPMSDMTVPKKPRVVPPSGGPVVYTWQVGINEQGEKTIVLIGEELQGGVTLFIANTAIPLEASSDGKKLTGKYPLDAPDNAVMSVAIQEDRQIVVPERFSRSKPDALPRIRDVQFEWIETMAPGRIREVGGKWVRALKITLSVERHIVQDVPATMYIGNVIVPPWQLTLSSNSLIAYVYRPSDLRLGLPITVDFGERLRVLAPKNLRFPKKK